MGPMRSWNRTLVLAAALTLAAGWALAGCGKAPLAPKPAPSTTSTEIQPPSPPVTAVSSTRAEPTRSAR